MNLSFMCAHDGREKCFGTIFQYFPLVLFAKYVNFAGRVHVSGMTAYLPRRVNVSVMSEHMSRPSDPVTRCSLASDRSAPAQKLPPAPSTMSATPLSHASRVFTAADSSTIIFPERAARMVDRESFRQLRKLRCQCDEMQKAHSSLVKILDFCSSRAITWTTNTRCTCQHNAQVKINTTADRMVKQQRSVDP